MEHPQSDGHARPNTYQALDAERCPFFNTVAALCHAALTPRTFPRERLAGACGCQDYEDCTTFLARLLNRTGSWK